MRLTIRSGSILGLLGALRLWRHLRRVVGKYKVLRWLLLHGVLRLVHVLRICVRQRMLGHSSVHG